MLVRKTVTIVFCDVTESTRLGESLDPETHRGVMSRYFEEMRSALEHHGGTVEKFIGDAVMAVFGVPTVHEDDALRAVRAAAEMRERLRTLNGELEERYGLSLQMRIGVNTGEVVAGDQASGHSLVTGDAVVVAKRLEEAAPPGEILIGKATYPLVRHAINAGPLQTFSAKGKSEVPSRQIEEVRAAEEGIARRFDLPLVGRERELELLRSELRLAERDRACRMVTLLGPAGIGKSRLVRELLADSRDGATGLLGRCLPYGDGITFWPLVDLIRGAGGEDTVRATLADEEHGAVAAERVLGAIGASDATASTEETFWGVRRYLETLARERPLIVGLEDIHWAEPTLLDLVDYLVGWLHDAPVLIVSLARPDLLERRPSWSAPRDNATILTLEPLSDEAISELLLGLAGKTAVRPDAQRRIAAAAEGNPLFLEQLTAMAAESGDGETLPIPPSIQAVIAERLDRLDPHERAVVESAAVVGKEFLRGAVVELTGPETQPAVGEALRGLVRKGLMRPHFSAASGEDGFRFGHVLIRDVAYEAMPKQLRAELHERFPDWIERNAGGRAGELEEIVAYHLEQAHRYRSELGPSDKQSRELARRASALLAGAGRRALAREDMPAAENLLERAVALGDGGDLELLRNLATALWAVGKAGRAEELLETVLEESCRAGNRGLEWNARLDLASHASVTGDGSTLEDVANEAVRVFEELGDELGLARAWLRLAFVARRKGCFGLAEEQSRRGLEHARRANDRREQARLTDALCVALLYGPAPVGRAVDECTRLLAEAEDAPVVKAGIQAALAGLRALQGEFVEASALGADARSAYAHLGLRLAVAGLTQVSGPVHAAAGDPQAAEQDVREGIAILSEAGHRAGYSRAVLAEALLAQDRVDEAAAEAALAIESSPPVDFLAHATSLTVQAKVVARSSPEHAVELARAAVAAAEAGDSPTALADAYAALADALLRAGRREEAAEAARNAIAAYERKENSVGAERARMLLAGANGDMVSRTPRGGGTNARAAGSP